jgi:hypothetical protein
MDIFLTHGFFYFVNNFEMYENFLMQEHHIKYVNFLNLYEHVQKIIDFKKC